MKKKSTLQNYTKVQLIDIVLCLQHNNEVFEQTLDQQYHNALKLLEEMNIFNIAYKECKENAEKR